MKKGDIIFCILLFSTIILWVIIIKQNKDLMSQINSLGNYLSQKLDNLSSHF